MSIFEDTQTTGTETTGTQSQSNQDDYVARVVAEKGDQWSDPSTLAKGYLSAQEYISELERQTKEMREDLDKQDYAKSLLEQIQDKGKPPVGESLESNDSIQGSNTNSGLSEDELKNLVKKAVGDMSAEERRQSNLKKVDTQMEQLFGTEARAEVEKRAKELGVSPTKMAEIAAESPDAFMRLIGEAPVKEKNETPHSSINTSSLSTNSNERNWAYYQNLRRENPRLARS